MPSRLSRRSFLAAGSGGPMAGGAEPEHGSALRLWYRQPAPDWNEALPIGSGRLGAMIFGGVAEERLQLNEDTLYSEEPGTSNLPLDVTKDFDRITEMLRHRQFAEAGDAMTKA